MENIFCAIENSPIHQRLLKYKDLTNESIHQLYQLKSISGIDFREAPLTKEIYDFHLNELHEDVHNAEQHLAQLSKHIPLHHTAQRCCLYGVNCA